MSAVYPQRKSFFQTIKNSGSQALPSEIISRSGVGLRNQPFSKLAGDSDMGTVARTLKHSAQLQKQCWLFYLQILPRPASTLVTPL